jgi:benzoyl-CoA reductase subunit D
MADRLLKLLKSIDANIAKDGVVMMTGGLALDAGLVKAMQAGREKQKMTTRIVAHADSLFAGAIGAALWGIFRHRKLKAKGLLPQASMAS